MKKDTTKVVSFSAFDKRNPQIDKSKQGRNAAVPKNEMLS